MLTLGRQALHEMTLTVPFEICTIEFRQPSVISIHLK